MDAKKKVLLVDDETIVREWFKERIRDSTEFTVVGEASNGAEGARFLREYDQPIQVIVLDLAIPERTGFELLEDIKKFQPDARLMIYTQYRDPAFVRKCRKYASVYMLKDEPISRVLTVLEIAAKGRDYVSPAIEMREPGLDEKIFSEDQLLLERLTAGQRKIIRHVASGSTSREIAEQLGCSPRTVEEQLRRIYRRLEIRNRAELSRLVARAGL